MSAILSKYSVIVVGSTDNTVGVKFLRKVVVPCDERTREDADKNLNRKLSFDPALRVPVIVYDEDKKQSVKTGKTKPAVNYLYIPEESFSFTYPHDGSPWNVKASFKYKEMALRYLVKESLKRHSKNAIEAAYAAVFASSAIATPVMLQDVAVSRYRVHFSEPPPVFPFQIHAAMMVERGHARDMYMDHICTVCGEHTFCRLYECGCSLCPAEFVKNFAYVPPRIGKCVHGTDLTISHPLGVTGIDWCYLAGHDPVPFADLIGSYAQKIPELKGKELDINNYLLPILSEKAANFATCLPRRSLSVWNLYDRSMYGEHSFPDGSIGAVHEKDRGRLTKDMCASQICAYMHDFFTTLGANLDSKAEIRILLQNAISSVFVASPKLEVIAAKRVVSVVDDDVRYSWKANPKARIFQMQNGITYGISRMFISPFTQNGGSGNFPYCQPSALGMNFTGDAATQFFCELYGVDPLRVIHATTDQIRYIEYQVLQERCIWEADGKTYDLSLKAEILMRCMMSVFERYDTAPSDEDSKFTSDMKYMFKLVCTRLVECVAVKITSRLDGKGFHSLIGTMASGSYETSYLNTICNLYHHLLVYTMYWYELEDKEVDEAVAIVSDHFSSGVIRLKLFGDDVLANHVKAYYPQWTGKFYRNTIHKYCNITVPEDDYVEATKIFITNETLGPVREKGVPTFLKFQLMCEGDRICFVRHDSLSIPKMFLSSEREMSKMSFYQRIICLMWTAGANYRTYYACRRALKILGEHVIGIPGDRSDMLSRFGLTNDVFRRGPPSYQEVISFHACPPLNYQPKRIRTVIPWPFICKYPGLKPYNFMNPREIEEEVRTEIMERQLGMQQRLLAAAVNKMEAKKVLKSWRPATRVRDLRAINK